ncbi:MAG: T9SS type A sorting domain-containing protein [Flavobacterium sp.]
MKAAVSLVLSIFSQLVIAQAPVIQWQKTFGGINTDNASSVIEQANGNILIGGASNSIISGDKAQNFNNFDDFWIINLSNTGATLWQNSFINTDGGDANNKVIINNTWDNNFILSGTIYYIDTTGMNLKKMNPSGNLLNLGHTGDHSSCTTTALLYGTQLSNCYITNENKYISGGTHLDFGLCDNTYNYYLQKNNTIAGFNDFIWYKYFRGDQQDILKTFIETTDDGYIMIGSSNSNIANEKTENSKGQYDYWIIKINSDGDIVWQKTIGGNDMEDASSIIQTVDGGYLIGGSSKSNISGDKTENSDGDYDYWIVKLDTNGTTEWQKTIGGSLNDKLAALKPTIDGGFILVGTSNSSISGDKTENSRGLNDIWIVKLNNQGTILWDKTIGRSLDDSANDVIQTNDGGFVVAGTSFSSMSGDKLENSRGNSDYWIIKLNPENLKINDSEKFSDIQIYPNPTNGFVSIEFGQNQEKTTITLTNILGQILSNDTYINTEKTLNYSIIGENGIYFIHVENDKKEKKTIKVIKK